MARTEGGTADAGGRDTKYVYAFAEGGRDQRDLLGGKGANLAEMARLGLPVPPGFTVTTDACRAYLAGARLEALQRADFEAVLRAMDGLPVTVLVYGLSRDDVEGRLMPAYLERGVLPANPFGTLDGRGVGRLLRMAAEEGRAANESLQLGICGEHGGDPASIGFCHDTGLDYVSCSPFRVPAARLAAAHAALGVRGPDDR